MHKPTLDATIQLSIAQKLEGMLGYLAWAVVCYLTLSAHPIESSKGVVRLFLIAAALLLAIYFFYLTTRDQPYNKARYRPFKNNQQLVRRLGFIGQLAMVVLIRWHSDPGVTADILISVALAAQVPICFGQFHSMLIIIALMAIDYCLHLKAGTEDAFFVSAMGGALQLLTIRIALRIIQEKAAYEQIAGLNKELVAMQELLKQSTEQSERLRISRDLHDGLGHGLSALILKLQYLTYTAKEPAIQQTVQQAYQMSRQLMQDVRETVGHMREKTELNLKEALEALITQTPNLKSQLHYDADVHIQDYRIAEVLFRCVQESITNTLKHTNADTLSIVLREEDEHLILQIEDNGVGASEFQLGNGLKGMQERVDAIGGQCEFTLDNHFILRILIPS
ncbi:sensor histidine kinase [Reinekea thalattae]|uniref:Sensor histidine kinase n=1 Tax=Reinekea thalattae TaxID=2593301 RepID=A0A5C8Z8B8_9GAMM|nr:sensor histidine kinase [Reinekea thalattae]TXR53498.1 sensor histidine kinase [Reinekea thalattae]